MEDYTKLTNVDLINVCRLGILNGIGLEFDSKPDDDGVYPDESGKVQELAEWIVGEYLLHENKITNPKEDKR